MKVQVTITGTLDLDKGDVKVLKRVSMNHVMDTMRACSKDMKVKIESPGKTKAASGSEGAEE